METNAQELLKKGFLKIAYPGNLEQLVKETMASWEQFCALPEEVKETFHFPDQGNIDGFGYQGLHIGKDPKELVEITRASLETLMKNAETHGGAVAQAFINNASNLINAIETPILDFAKRVEQGFSTPNFVDEVLQSKNHWMIRIIHYFGNAQVEQEVGGAHADKSGYTLKLYESTPGLQYLDLHDRTWKNFPMKTTHTIIIPNLQLQLRSEGKLKALWHRVVATPESASTGRFSMVCFINLTQTPVFDRTRQGYIQTKEPGFNYDIESETFETLFAPPKY